MTNFNLEKQLAAMLSIAPNTIDNVLLAHCLSEVPSEQIKIVEKATQVLSSPEPHVLRTRIRDRLSTLIRRGFVAQAPKIHRMDARFFLTPAGYELGSLFAPFHLQGIAEYGPWLGAVKGEVSLDRGSYVRYRMLEELKSGVREGSELTALLRLNHSSGQYHFYDLEIWGLVEIAYATKRCDGKGLKSMRITLNSLGEKARFEWVNPHRECFMGRDDSGVVAKASKRFQNESDYRNQLCNRAMVMEEESGFQKPVSFEEVYPSILSVFEQKHALTCFSIAREVGFGRDRVRGWLTRLVEDGVLAQQGAQYLLKK